MYRVLDRLGMHRLPTNQKHQPHGKRWQRYEKPEPMSADRNRGALGATSSQVVRRALGRVAVLVRSGVAAGIVLSVWASRFLERLVFGVAPSDVATLTAARLTLLAVGGLAAWSPARGATRTDAATVLREG